jgi:dienelactone hydrolase
MQIFKVALSIFLVCSFLKNNSLKAQPVTIKYMTSDKVLITADVYAPNAADAAFIILFHQAKYSRGEFLEIAPKLNSLGFNCMAVDLRSGEETNGIENQTWKYCDSLKMETRFIDAYSDIRASISYIRRKFPTAKVILFGSGYSASLSLKMAGDNPSGISAVVAFSPGEYFSAFGWSRDIIQISSSHIKCPVFITSARSEEDNWRKIFEAIPVQTKSSFIPQQEGKNGAKVLWSVFPENEEYWKALKMFLTKYFSKGK